MPSYNLRPRPDRRAARSSRVPLDAKRRTSSSSSYTYNPLVYREWDEAPTYDNEGNMNVPKLPCSLAKALEEGMGTRVDRHQWRKLDVPREFVSS